jgi:hypothetical protein
MVGHDTTKSVLDDLDPEERAKLRRKAKIRFAVALFIAALATFGWVYVRYLIPKAPLGGPCKYAMNCQKDAPRCMRPDVDEDGVCSRPCQPDPPDAGAGAIGDCGEGIRCVEIELDEERDERGMPQKGGYCFPKAFLEARKAKSRRGGDAGKAP